MNDSEKLYWKNQIEAVKNYMAPKHKVWRRLLKTYAMEFEGLRLGNAEIRKVSRFYPLTRQIMASVTFKYPEVFFQVENEQREFAAEILQRVNSAAFDLMNIMPEVRQQTFDALYCYCGFLKTGYNKPGDDSDAPYIANDAMADDMPFVRRVSPFNVYVDPNCAPQNIAYAEFIAEKMLVPLEYVMKDKRFDNKNNLNPISLEDASIDDMLQDFVDSPLGGDEEVQALKDSINNRKMIVIWEVHARTQRKRITLSDKFDVLEEIPHPFLDVENEFQKDEQGAPRMGPNGRPLLSGVTTPKGGYIVKSGTPYIPLRFDMPGESFYGLPPMAYVEDSQKTIVESISRRNDLLKRMSRIVLGMASEKTKNETIEDRLRDGDDLVIAWVQDIDKAFRALDLGHVPPDLMGLEGDMRQYEEQTLQVSQMAMGGGSVRSATESALIAGFGQLNREWMQSGISDVFKTITHNIMRIMADERYTPQEFMVNVARDDNDPIFEAVQADLFKTRFKIHVVPGSMQPLTEQLEKEDTLALVNYLTQFPEVNREEVLKLVLRAFRVPNVEKIMGPTFQEEAMRAAQMENQLIITAIMMGGSKPFPVLPNQNHQVHLQAHPQVQQDPMFQGLQPPQQQQVLQIVQQHMQQHEQMMGNQAQGGAPTGQNGNINGFGGSSGGGGGALEMADNTLSGVRSNAQHISQNVAANPDQN